MTVFNVLDWSLALPCLRCWWSFVACVSGACPCQTPSEAGHPPSKGQLQDTSVFCVLNKHWERPVTIVCGQEVALLLLRAPTAFPRLSRPGGPRPLVTGGPGQVTWMHCEARGLKIAGSQDHVGHPGGRLSANLSCSSRGLLTENRETAGRGDTGGVKGGPDQGPK